GCTRPSASARVPRSAPARSAPSPTWRTAPRRGWPGTRSEGSCTASGAAHPRKPRPSTTLDSTPESTPVTRNRVCIKPGMLHMSEHGLCGLPRPGRRIPNLIKVNTPEDLVKRQFSATRPNELWCTDITEHQARAGKVYCCAILDCFSRMIVARTFSTTADTALVNNAVNMAVAYRNQRGATILHADHGTQFTSWSFGENVRRWGLLASFGTVGDCYDNAAMESFWGRLQVELLNTRKWATTLELAAAIADYIDNFYNVERRHSYL